MHKERNAQHQIRLRVEGAALVRQVSEIRTWLHERGYEPDLIISQNGISGHATVTVRFNLAGEAIDFTQDFIESIDCWRAKPAVARPDDGTIDAGRHD